jgi:hypothetical protein
LSSSSIRNATAISYVKFVAAAGSCVIPLVYNEPEERLLFRSICIL